MCENVVAGESPVGNKYGGGVGREAFNELAEGGEFIFQPSRLEGHIQVSFRNQVKQRDGMEGVKPLFRPAAGRMEGGGVIRVTGDIKFTAINSDEGILSQKHFQREAGIELF